MRSLKNPERFFFRQAVAGRFEDHWRLVTTRHGSAFKGKRGKTKSLQPDSFRANRIKHIDDFRALVEAYGNGSGESVKEIKSKTSEEFYMWLERKIKSAKKLEVESRKLKAKSKK